MWSGCHPRCAHLPPSPAQRASTPQHPLHQRDAAQPARPRVRSSQGRLHLLLLLALPDARGMRMALSRPSVGAGAELVALEAAQHDRAGEAPRLARPRRATTSPRRHLRRPLRAAPPPARARAERLLLQGGVREDGRYGRPRENGAQPDAPGAKGSRPARPEIAAAATPEQSRAAGERAAAQDQLHALPHDARLERDGGRGGQPAGDAAAARRPLPAAGGQLRTARRRLPPHRAARGQRRGDGRARRPPEQAQRGPPATQEAAPYD
mmetsp:Transcript_51651/g.110349  ORF Transcript_51651/g.110349 Transcript_51651/m.110349 type:complete len:266 (-) Transcript_51651:344-1141(-)